MDDLSGNPSQNYQENYMHNNMNNNGGFGQLGSTSRARTRQTSSNNVWPNGLGSGTQSNGGGGGEMYEDMVAQKLTELQGIQQQKIRGLELRLIEKDNEIAGMAERYSKLEEDFAFNLSVIEARDADLEELKSKMNQLRDVCEEKSAEIAQLKVNSDSADKNLEDVKARMSDKNRHLYEKIDVLKSELKFQRATYTQELLNSKELATQLAALEASLADRTAFIEKQHAKTLEGMKASHAAEVAKVQQQYFDLQNQRGHQTAEIQNQNERLLRQTEDLLAERTSLKQQLLEKERAMSNEINTCNTRVQEAIVLAQHAQQEAATLKHASANWEDVMKERINSIQIEKESVAESLASYKVKSKAKIAQLRDESERRLEEIVKENAGRIKRLTMEMRDLQSQSDFTSLSEKHLKERMQEMQANFRREIEETEARLAAQLRNAEEDKRQAKNEVDLKTFQVNQLAAELDRESRSRMRFESEIEDLTKQNEDLSAEIAVLIQELVVLRQNAAAVAATGKTQNKTANKHSRKQGSFNDFDDEDVSFERILKDDDRKLQQQNQQIDNFQRIKQLESEVNTYKELIDNMSFEMESVKQKLQLNNQELRMSREECMELRNRISECKLDAVSYRERLQRLELENRELSSQVADAKTYEQIQATVRLKDEAIKELKEKVDRSSRDLITARRERDALAEISSTLKSKCMDLEDKLGEFEDIDPAVLSAQNSLQLRQLQELADSLDRAESDLATWRRLDQEKSMVIESLRNELMKNNQLIKAGNTPALSVVSHYNHMKRQEVIRKNNQQTSASKEIPKYDAFNQIDDQSQPESNSQQHPVRGTSQENNSLAMNAIQRKRSPEAKTFKKQLISLYDHISPDSNQFIQGNPEH